MVWLDVYAYGGGNWNYSVTDSQRFVWDGDQMAATLDPAGHLLQTYTYGPTGLVAVSDYTQSQGNVSTYVVVSDLSGNVQGLLNTDGAVVASYHYGPFGEGFGEVVSPALINGDPNPFGFGGGWTDPVSGLVYFHNRWYSPSQGRFISEDPSGIDGGVNLFTYTNNDPITTQSINS